jgi:hypothetical protein
MKGESCKHTVNRFFALANICSALLLNACVVYSSSPLAVVLFLLLPNPSRSKLSSVGVARSAFNLSLIPALVSNPSQCRSDPVLILEQVEISLSRFSCFWLHRVVIWGAIVGELAVGLGVLLLARFDLGELSSSPMSLRGAPCS